MELKLVIMVDEFPSTVANIAKKSGDGTAVRFLQMNRTLRQISTKAVQMIYTGSIGLPALVSRLSASESVNDMYNFEIPPFTAEEAFDLCKTLFAKEQVNISDELIRQLLERIGWLMPFFVQLAVSQVSDIYFDNKKTPVTAENLEEAIERSSGLRNNNHFESYYQRINNSFKADGAAFAHDLLRKIAHQDAVPVEEAFTGADGNETERRRFILNSLELDGYITQFQGTFRFHSPILQQ